MPAGLYSPHMNRIREIRQQLSLSQEDMAEKLGMTRARLSLLERGKAKLRRYYVMAAEYLAIMEKP